jgi:hypothetical protein
MKGSRNLDRMTETETEIGEEKLKEMLNGNGNGNANGNANANANASVKKIAKKGDRGLPPRKRRTSGEKEANPEREIRRHLIRIEEMIKRIVLTEKPLTGRIEEEMMTIGGGSKTDRRTEIVSKQEIKGMKSLQARVKSLKISARF